MHDQSFQKPKYYEYQKANLNLNIDEQEERREVLQGQKW